MSDKKVFNLTIEEFYAAEKARIGAEREAFLADKDYKTFVKWEQGVTGFTLEPVIPRDHESFGKNKKVFRITIDGEEYDWPVSPRSPMYREVLDRLLEAPVEMRLNRLGEGLQTRYSLI